MTITVNPNIRGVELAQATAEYITAHPEEWNQDTWGRKTACGTTACVAGTAVLIAGLARWDYLAGAVRLDGSTGEAASTAFGIDYYGDDEDNIWDLFHGSWHRDETADVPEDEDFPLLPLADRLKEMWRRVAALFPEGAIKIPTEYR